MNVVQLVQHHKGAFYHVLFDLATNANEDPEQRGKDVVVYRSESDLGKIFTRDRAEFLAKFKVVKNDRSVATHITKHGTLTRYYREHTGGAAFDVWFPTEFDGDDKQLKGYWTRSNFSRKDLEGEMGLTPVVKG